VKKTAAVFAILLTLACCSPHGRKSAADAGKPAQAAPSVPAYEAGVPGELRTKIAAPFKGDLDAMIGRRLIRVAATFNRTAYFLDGGVQRGLSYEYVKLYEEKLNESLGEGHPRVYVVILPIPRDQLLPDLNEGKVDMAAAQLTITPERAALVDFTVPTRTGINEIPVTGPGTSPIRSLDELSGKTMFVRRSSSYFKSIENLNGQLASHGKAPVRIEAAPENLEDDDLLEMVNAGLVPGTVVDNYLAQFWAKILPKIVLGEQAPLRTGGSLAIAIRKGSPKLAASLNEFISKNGLNSAIGAVLNQRYLQNAAYVKNAASNAERRKFEASADIFRKYGRQYHFDYLMMAAQGISGIAARSGRAKPGRSTRRDAAIAGDGKGPGRRRHQPDRPQHPRRRQIYGLHGASLFRQRADGQRQQGALHLRRLQRRPREGPQAAAGSAGEGPQPQRLVRQCRAGRGRADRR